MSNTDSAPQKHHKQTGSIRHVGLRGGNLDLRYGHGNLMSSPKQIRTKVGKPHRCLIFFDQNFDEDIAEELTFGFRAEGFEVFSQTTPPGQADLVQVEAMCAHLYSTDITSGDLVVVVGALPALSVASFVCSSWKSGVSLAIIPTDQVSVLLGATSPLEITVGEAYRVLSYSGGAHFEIIDTMLYDLDPTAEISRLAFAHMAVSAMSDSEKAFEKLWDAADGLLAKDEDVYLDCLADAVKSRGKVSSSFAASTRKSLSYGSVFARSLKAVAGDKVQDSVCLADGLRFCARISVARNKISIDDMFTQDELLEKLGLESCSVSVDPDELTETLVKECFSTSKRFMMELPDAIGKVRSMVVDRDLLQEHVYAWCSMR